MIRKSLLAIGLVALLGVSLLGASSSLRAQAPVLRSADSPREIANDLVQAFPAQVDIYLATDNDFEYGRPSLSDVKFVACSVIGGVTYYVVRHGNNSDTFLPQSQIVAIHNRK